MLSEGELERFRRDGYVVAPGFLGEDRAASVAEDVDRYAATEPRFDGRNVWRYDRLCGLVTDGPTLAVVDQLMGGDPFAFHHCHAARHEAGLGGVNWHHDYEQVPQTNRSHLQVHVLHYLDGLDGTIGDLLLLRGSHRAVMRRDALWGMGTEDLPGTVVVDDVPPGTVVFAHSALVHARRPKPGGEGRSRYFIDIAFVQAGVLWPSYGRDGWDEMLRRMGEHHGVPERPGLFDPAAFFDIADAVARLEGTAGSLALLLPEPTGDRPQAGAIPVVQ